MGIGKWCFKEGGCGGGVGSLLWELFLLWVFSCEDVLVRNEFFVFAR